MSFSPGQSNFQAIINQPYVPHTPQHLYAWHNVPMNNINTFSNADVTRLLNSATGEMLLQAGNEAYIQLLRNQSLGAQLAQRISEDNTLINAKLDALNNKLTTQDRRLYPGYIPESTSTPTNDSDPAVAIIRRDTFLKFAFPLAHSHENIILKQQDYPEVRFWAAESFRSWLSQQQLPKGAEKRVLHRGGIFTKKIDYFLEDKNGNLVSYTTILSIRQYLRNAFAGVKSHVPELLAPSCGGRLDQALLNVISHELRIIYPELALCAQDWKVLDLLSRWCSHWNKKGPGRAEDEDYFNECDEDEQGSGSYSSFQVTGEASARNASAATKKHGLPEETSSTSMAFKKVKIEHPVGNSLQTAGVQNAPNATVNFENNNIDHGISSNITRQLESPWKRRIEPGSTEQRVTSSFQPRNLCAIDWKTSHPNGTTNEFRAYWSSLGSDGQAKWTNISIELKVKRDSSHGKDSPEKRLVL